MEEVLSLGKKVFRKKLKESVPWFNIQDTKSYHLAFP